MVESFGLVHVRSAAPSRGVAVSPVGLVNRVVETSFDQALAPTLFTARTWNA